jgi:hypothetical protein
MKLILATGSDWKYIKKIGPYLNSISINSNFDMNILVFVGRGRIYIPKTTLNIAKLPIRNIRSLNANKCVQHGDFLNSKEFDSMTSNEDIIFYTDGDIILQRNLSIEEVDFCKSLRDGDVYVGYNASPVDTLADEALRLKQTGILSSKLQLDQWSKIKIYNTGVLAMNKKTWRILLEKYCYLFPHVDIMFNHYAKQQWLISYIIGTVDDFNIIEMGYHVHNHKHYSSPEGTTQDGKGDVYFNGIKVLFKHKW